MSKLSNGRHTMKLYELPRDQGVKIYGLKDIDNNNLIIIFGHIDGAYSYCWIEDKTNGDKDQVIHLPATTPLEEYKDGYKVKE